MITKRERAAKQLILKQLAKEGYGSNKHTGNKVTYASLFDLFDLHLTNDPSTVAYVTMGKGSITVNENLDVEQISFVVRHEILHEYLDHYKRFQRHLVKKRGLNSPDELQVTPMDHELQNIAADYELSNRGYTEKDKITAKHLKLGKEVVQGLVTDIDHPEWVNLTMEQIYDKLDQENEEFKQQLIDMLKNNPQLDKPGNQDLQDIEDIERTATALEELADDMEKEANDQSGEGEKSKEGKEGKSSEDSSSDLSDDNPESDEDSSSDSEGKQNDTTAEKESGKDSTSKSSVKQLRDRAKQLKDKAQKLKDAAEEQGEQVKDRMEEDDEDPLRTPEEVQSDADLQERIKKIKELAESEEAKQDILDSTYKKIEASDLKKSERELRNFRKEPLVGFELSLNNLIKKQTMVGRDKTWRKFNKNYIGTNLIKKGSMRSENKHIPLLNVYFDVSGSVEPYVENTRKVLTTLNQYVRGGKLRVNIWYVSNKMSRVQSDSTGGGADGNLIMDDIIATKPDNVVIMTDGDANGGAAGYEHINIPGGLFFIFPDKGYIPDNLIKNLSGLTVEQTFYIENSRANRI